MCTSTMLLLCIRLMSRYVNVCSIICLAPQTEFDHDPLDKTYSDVISMLSFGARLSYILYLSGYLLNGYTLSE
jgi:hypothetical protein